MSSANLEILTPCAALVGRQLLDVDEVTGTVRLSFLAKPEFANRHGTVSGGFLATMLDSTTAVAILAMLPDELTILTTELHMYYEKPARIGQLLGVGRVSKRSEREAHCEGELSHADGSVVARASARFRIVKRR